jgi:hypothetical protein
MNDTNESNKQEVCTGEVCTEKYRTEVFFVQIEPVGRGLYKKTEFRWFSVHTEQGRLIKSLLYSIYSWNKQEMHDLKSILAAWYTFGRRKQKYQCIPSFPLKTIRRYRSNNKLNYNFQLVLLFCFKMHAFVFT